MADNMMESEFDHMLDKNNEGYGENEEDSDSEDEDNLNSQPTISAMRPVTDLFGPNVDLLWANKRSKRGKFVKMGKTAGCTLPPEISEALSQGHMHYANGSHSEALEHLSKVTRLAPHLPDPFHIMGLIYEESGDKLASLQFFVLAAVHTPKSADVWMKVCDLATDLKQYDQAMSALNHALKREKSVPSYVKKILLLIKMDQVNSAKHQLKLFLDKYPEEIPFLADYAYACQIAGYLEMATQSYLRLAYHIMGSKDTNIIFLNIYQLQREDHYGQDLETVELDRLTFVIQQVADILLEKSITNSDHLHTVTLVINSLLEYYQRLHASIPVESFIAPPKLSTEIILLYSLSKLYLRKEPHVGVGLKMIMPVLAQLRADDAILNSDYEAAVEESNNVTDIDTNIRPEEDTCVESANITDPDTDIDHMAVVAEKSVETAVDGAASTSASAEDSNLSSGDIKPKEKPALSLEKQLELKEKEEEENSIRESERFLLKQRLRVADELCNLGMHSMGQRTVTDIALRISRLNLPGTENAVLLIRLGAIYEKTKKFEMALNAYMTCIELDVNNPVPLYRFVMVSRVHNTVMVRHALRLLGIHFLSFLAEYESTRQSAIDNEGTIVNAAVLEKNHEKNKALKRQQQKKDVQVPYTSANLTAASDEILRLERGIEITSHSNIKRKFSGKADETEENILGHSSGIVEITDSSHQVDLKKQKVGDTEAEEDKGKQIGILDSVDADATSSSSSNSSGGSSLSLLAQTSSVIEEGVVEQMVSEDIDKKSEISDEVDTVNAENIDIIEINQDQQVDKEQQEQQQTEKQQGIYMNARRFPRFTIEDELRAIALWAIMLRETGDEMSFCCIMLPMLDAWLVNLRGGGYWSQVGVNRYRIREKLLEEFVFLSELQTNIAALRYHQAPWFDETQNSMGRLVTALCEYVSIEDVIGKETLEEGTLKCKASMERFQQSIPSNPPETEGVLSSEQSTNGPALVETQSSQDVINQQGKLKSLLDSCMWTVSRRKRGTSRVREIVRSRIPVVRSTTQETTIDEGKGTEHRNNDINDDDNPVSNDNGLEVDDDVEGKGKNSNGIEYANIISFDNRNNRGNGDHPQNNNHGRNPYEDFNRSNTDLYSDALELDNLYHQLMDTAASRGLRAAPYEYGGPAKGGDDEDGNKTKRKTTRRPAHCMEFVANAMTVSKAAGSAANAVILDPFNVKFANSLARALFDTGSFGMQVSMEGLLSWNKLYTVYPTSILAVMLSGYELASQTKNAEAMGRYIDAFCIDPDQPLIALVLATHCLFLSQHTLVRKRHETLVKSFACLEKYKQNRLRGSTYAIGTGLPIPRLKTNAEPNISHYKGDICDDGKSSYINGVPESDAMECSSSSSSSSSPSVPSSSTPSDVLPGYILSDFDINNITAKSNINNTHKAEILSDVARLQEVHYNYARAFHEIKLQHLAEKYYLLALQVADDNQWLIGNADKIDPKNKGGNSHSDSGYFRHLQVTREAAHNLVIIYKISGAMDQALEIMQKYLVF